VLQAICNLAANGEALYEPVTDLASNNAKDANIFFVFLLNGLLRALRVSRQKIFT
jgi:hypothetical protein